MRAPRCACLCHTEMQRVTHFRRKHPVRLNHPKRIAGFDRDGDVREIVCLAYFDVPHRALQECVRCRRRVFLQQVLLKRTLVHADANRDIRRFSGRQHLLNPFFAADIAGVNAHLRHTRIHRCKRIAIVEMDVGHNRHRRAFDERAERVRVLLFRDSDADDLRARLRATFHLCKCRVNIVRQRRRHCLDRNRTAAADGDITHHNFPGGTFVAELDQFFHRFFLVIP